MEWWSWWCVGVEDFWNIFLLLIVLLRFVCSYSKSAILVELTPTTNSSTTESSVIEWKLLDTSYLPAFNSLLRFGGRRSLLGFNSRRLFAPRYEYDFDASWPKTRVATLRAYRCTLTELYWTELNWTEWSCSWTWCTQSASSLQATVSQWWSTAMVWSLEGFHLFWARPCRQGSYPALRLTKGTVWLQE